MNKRPAPLTPEEHEKRIADLATGFAQGELDILELNELYERLRESGESGSRAARVTWEVLGTVTDLRAAISTRFEDTVDHRVRTGAGDDASGDDSTGFVSGLMGRLGVRRRTLQEVDTPLLGHGPRAGLKAVALIAALICLGGYLLFVQGRPTENATIRGIKGGVMVEGKYVSPGQSLDGRPVILQADARLTLEWPDGHAVTILGPANVVPHDTGISLSSGQARVRAADPFTLGLPDGQAVCPKNSHVTAWVYANRSVVAARSGNLTLRLQEKNDPVIVKSGWAADTTGAMFRYETVHLPPPAISNTRLDTGLDRSATAWELSIRVGFDSVEGSCGLYESSAGSEDTLTLAIAPGELVLFNDLAEPEPVPLPGPPLLERTLRFWRAPGQPVRMRVDGLAEDREIHIEVPPAAIELNGAARLESMHAHTGPLPPEQYDEAAE